MQTTNDFPTLGSLLTTINSLCGVVNRHALSRVRVVCDPGPIEGNIIIVQRNGTRELHFEEIDVLVLNSMGESALSETRKLFMKLALV